MNKSYEIYKGIKERVSTWDQKGLIHTEAELCKFYYDRMAYG